MLDKLLPKLDFLKDSKIMGPRFDNAMKKAKESKDKGFLSKILIFAKTFIFESGKITKEKKEVKAAASKAAKQGVDETMADARKVVNLDSIRDGKDKEFFDEVLAMSVTSYEGMDEDHQTSASVALGKIDEANEGKEAEPFTFDEAGSLMAVGFKTLKQLKARYPEREDFKSALDRIIKLSDSSSYPLKKLLSSHALKLFKITDKSEGLKFLNAFGIEASFGDAFGSGDASDAKDLMSDLSKKPMQKKEKVSAFMKEHIFPHTDNDDVSKVVEVLNEMITESGDSVNSRRLTDLVFYINPQDYDHLITALVGTDNAGMEKLSKAA